MITKAAAQQLRAAYIASLPDRIDAAILQTATFGGTSVTVSYAPAPDATAQAIVTVAQGAPNNWTTSSVDTVNKTITIAP